MTSHELSDVVDLLTASSTAEQNHFVLAKPREAVRQPQADYVHHWDPRMSSAGNRAAKRLALLLDCLAKMDNRHHMQSASLIDSAMPTQSRSR